jgi:hypothetical protein
MALPSSPRHAFDFWIGHWDVFGPQGRQVGTNAIVALCETGTLAEHWRGEGGVEGHSLSAWDDLRGCWHQTWVDSSGGLLLLDGGLTGGSMVMEGVAPAEEPGSASERQRITWTPADGEVRQLWEVSGDDGATWRTAFDGRYRRRHPGGA